jgi:hypothetical protein
MPKVLPRLSIICGVALCRIVHSEIMRLVLVTLHHASANYGYFIVNQQYFLCGHLI